MAYNVYDVKIRKADRKKADNILLKHWNNGDIDTLIEDGQKNSNGIDTVVYWICPYIYEDYEAILNEFKQEGIRII